MKDRSLLQGKPRKTFQAYWHLYDLLSTRHSLHLFLCEPTLWKCWREGERALGRDGIAPGTGWTSCEGVRDKWKEGCEERVRPCEEMRVWAQLRHSPFSGFWHPYRLSSFFIALTHSSRTFFFQLFSVVTPSSAFTERKKKHFLLLDHL